MTDDEDDFLYSEEALDLVVEVMRVLVTFITSAYYCKAIVTIVLLVVLCTVTATLCPPKCLNFFENKELYVIII